MYFSLDCFFLNWVMGVMLPKTRSALQYIHAEITAVSKTDVAPVQGCCGLTGETDVNQAITVVITDPGWVKCYDG